MSSSDLSSPMSAGRASEHSGHAAERPAQGPQEGFIYVYEMPDEFTDDLTQLPVQWHPSQYDYDQVGRTNIMEQTILSSPKAQPTAVYVGATAQEHRLCLRWCLGCSETCAAWRWYLSNAQSLKICV